jgi:hypothetical protein
LQEQALYQRVAQTIHLQDSSSNGSSKDSQAAQDEVIDV